MLRERGWVEPVLNALRSKRHVESVSGLREDQFSGTIVFGGRGYS